MVLQIGLDRKAQIDRPHLCARPKDNIRESSRATPDLEDTLPAQFFELPSGLPVESVARNTETRMPVELRARMQSPLIAEIRRVGFVRDESGYAKPDRI